MQTDVPTVLLAGRAAALILPRRTAVEADPPQTTLAPRGTAALWQARGQASRAWAREELVWLAVFATALATLVLCFGQ